ncbi:hypothetical protein KEM52_001504 [Ascosphaera acerosa]|nr:hypothetical protein KEM52_001504 [Ascosphaera acerosa]
MWLADRYANGSADVPRTSTSFEQSPAPDPLDVLCSIIGKRELSKCRKSREGANDRDGRTSDANGGGDAACPTRPAELQAEVAFGDLSLEEFAQQQTGRQADEGGQADDRNQETGLEEVVRSYDTQKQRYEALHEDIAAASSTLQSVESYLVRFQTDLGAVSAEIESLQSRSTLLASQLENRRKLESLLGPAVQNIIVSPACVQAVVGSGSTSSEKTQTRVDHRLVRACAEIEEKERYIKRVKSGQEQGIRDIKALEDVKPLLQGLRTRATVQIRDYLVAQIKNLRAPNVNAQFVQQNAMLKYKELFAFLQHGHPQLALDLTQAYTNTMKWYYTTLFQRYLTAMETIKVHQFDKNDLLGVDPATVQKSVFQSQRSPTAEPFTLGRRIDILRTHNTMAISTQLAESDKASHGIEIPFRNFTLALIDNLSTEFTFVSDFFAPALSSSFHQASRRVTEIFDTVLAQGQAFTKGLVDNCLDCLGLLLCVRLNQHFAFELQRRKVPVADAYINGVNMMLWPRFQIVMDMHCESVRKAASSAAVSQSRGAFLASSLLESATADSASTNDSSPAGRPGSAGGSSSSSAPHLITQRFGQFLQGILLLASEAGDDEPVGASLGRLRAEFDILLRKLSKSCAGSDAKRRQRFCVNNYALVLTIISDTQGKLANQMKEEISRTLHTLRKPA